MDYCVKVSWQIERKTGVLLENRMHPVHCNWREVFMCSSILVNLCELGEIMYFLKY